MKRIHDVVIERDKVVTPQGQYPFNARSAVWVRLIRRKQNTKKLIAAGLFVAAVATGGAAILLGAPAGAFLFHESFEVVLSTDGVEFVVRQFTAVMGSNERKATELKDTIAESIAEYSE